MVGEVEEIERGVCAKISLQVLVAPFSRAVDWTGAGTCSTRTFPGISVASAF